MALALLGNTLPTGAMLVVLITILGPISGAHFNPAVSLVFALKHDLPAGDARFMWRTSRRRHPRRDRRPSHVRAAAHATFRRRRAPAARNGSRNGWRPSASSRRSLPASGFERSAVPWLVGLYITAAYWFTASTSFANPAVAIARSLTNTFSGIRPIDLPEFHRRRNSWRICALALMSGCCATRSMRPTR